MPNVDVKEHERDHAPLEQGLQTLLTPFENFFQSQSASGILLVLAAIAALFFSNSSYQEHYQAISHLTLTVSLDDWSISHSLQHWVNDGFMVLFFFVLGLEIKRECLAGDLRDIRHASLALGMAAGGMIFPALIYAAVASIDGDMAMQGWGIPIATDTAFALGILALLGSRAPRSAAVIMSALAIIDDIGAVLVIGLFYTEQLQTESLLWAAGVMGVLLLGNLLGIRKPLFYITGGLVLWWLISQSGIHATTAGILAALAVPTKPYAETGLFIRQMRRILRKFEELDEPNRSILEQENQHELIEQTHHIANRTTTPLQHWGSVLDKPVSLTILPLFAFLNAGVLIPDSLNELVTAPVTLGVCLGLVAGKAIGISSFAYLMIKSGFSTLPEGLLFRHIIGLSFLAGIGFTMSLFIAALAFSGQAQLIAQAKIGILIGSLIAGTLGALAFIWVPEGGRENT
ncbi:Na+/H+ antiporter NhaA [Oceanicoccus sp. KOV_DT_Chl]|uniref:Na+/H+ antiporter NhaA n=1 Tax=Oceanicoccus sp. KOV_DT_Chl TaxID=1904639 RepID=UPI000C7AB099|nr:Na+/H+ antiporter NhaA [Oceanicoccus sp. KOV_DT_Chl]